MFRFFMGVVKEFMYLLFCFFAFTIFISAILIIFDLLEMLIRFLV